MQTLRTLALALAACATLAPWANAESPLHGYTTVLPVTRSVPVPSVAIGRLVKPLPQWRYTIKAAADLGGGTYSGNIIGTDPHAAVKTSTTLPTQIVPLVITINDGTSTVTYDPTKPDSCSTTSAINTVKNSPIFTTTTPWGMNGQYTGTTQYIDAFQRAEFWSLVHGTNYHVLLSPSVLASQKFTFTGASHGSNNEAAQFGGCGHIGVVNQQDMDARVQALITGALATSINAGTFPIFITKDVVMADPGVSLTNNCCILGYHSGLRVGGHLQIYSPFSLDVSGLFGGDVNTLSHEMGEAINDPSGSNPTPVWGNIGQQSQCQNNFEVGDPLSEGFSTPTRPFVVAAPGGVKYHLQEMAFLSWFYGGPSLGAGGKYSDHGTFTGYQRLCSAGGGTH